MAYEIALVPDITLTAGESLATKQFYFVKLNSSGQVILPTANTDIPIAAVPVVWRTAAKVRAAIPSEG